jgi:hypothetical protein
VAEGVKRDPAVSVGRHDLLLAALGPRDGRQPAGCHLGVEKDEIAVAALVEPETLGVLRFRSKCSADRPVIKSGLPTHAYQRLSIG